MGGRNLRSRTPGLIAAAIVLAVAGGCSDGDDAPGDRAAAEEVAVVQPGAPGEPSRTLSADELEAPAPTPHTPADVDFMQGMIHHHAQALVMTRLARERATKRDVALLAKRIDVSQAGELELMEGWLAARDEEVPDAEDHAREHGPHGRLMPGMVGERELARLAAADGRAFDRLFVDYMIRHHQGALTMVGDLRASEGAGAEPELDAFARHVDADQHIEILRMEELRARLPSAPAEPPGAAGSGAGSGGVPPALCILA
jgi:uncharacterized protein (DUF305 family)